MQKIIENIVRMRNPDFRFDDDLSSLMFFQFALNSFIQIIRGSKTLLIFKNPRWAMFGRGVQLNHAQKITWGKFLKLGSYVKINAMGTGKVLLGNAVSIGDYSRLIIGTSLNQLGSFIKIGNYVGMGEFAYIGGGGGVEIGDDCIIGQYFSVHPENHHFSKTDIEIRRQGVSRKGITIGKDCWIGSKVTVLDGVRLGDHCVIAAGSVVTQSFPPYSIIAGVPAKMIKTRRADISDIYHNNPITL